MSKRSVFGSQPYAPDRSYPQAERSNVLFENVQTFSPRFQTFKRTETKTFEHFGESKFSCVLAKAETGAFECSGLERSNARPLSMNLQNQDFKRSISERSNARSKFQFLKTHRQFFFYSTPNFLEGSG